MSTASQCIVVSDDNSDDDFEYLWRPTRPHQASSLSQKTREAGPIAATTKKRKTSTNATRPEQHKHKITRLDDSSTRDCGDPPLCGQGIQNVAQESVVSKLRECMPPPKDESSGETGKPTPIAEATRATSPLRLRPLFEDAPRWVQTSLSGQITMEWRRPDPHQSTRTNLRSARPCTLEQRALLHMRDVIQFTQADWSGNVDNLCLHHNPRHVRFQNLPPQRFCACIEACRVNTCPNARDMVFCAGNCCPYAGLCGNGLEPSRALLLVKRKTSPYDLTVVAALDIPADIVLGEYVGELRKEKVDPRSRPANNGYRLMIKRDLDHALNQRVIVDASKKGNLMRFLNHSCEAACRFRQVHNGRDHTIVVVSNRAIRAGEEVTVDYGDDIWFVCQCGRENCCHRHLNKSGRGAK